MNHFQIILTPLPCPDKKITRANQGALRLQPTPTRPSTPSSTLTTQSHPCPPHQLPFDALASMLIGGNMFIKHGRRGKPQARWLWLSPDRQSLLWRRNGDLKVCCHVKTTT